MSPGAPRRGFVLSATAPFVASRLSQFVVSHLAPFVVSRLAPFRGESPSPFVVSRLPLCFNPPGRARPASR